MWGACCRSSLRGVLAPFLLTLHTARTACAVSQPGSPWREVPVQPSPTGPCWERGMLGVTVGVAALLRSSRRRPHQGLSSTNTRSVHESTRRILVPSLTGASRFKTGSQETKGTYLIGGKIKSEKFLWKQRQRGQVRRLPGRGWSASPVGPKCQALPPEPPARPRRKEVGRWRRGPRCGVLGVPALRQLPCGDPRHGCPPGLRCHLLCEASLWTIRVALFSVLPPHWWVGGWVGG